MPVCAVSTHLCPLVLAYLICTRHTLVRYCQLVPGHASLCQLTSHAEQQAPCRALLASASGVHPAKELWGRSGGGGSSTGLCRVDYSLSCVVLTGSLANMALTALVWVSLTILDLCQTDCFLT